jgi:hypothetical protein
VTKRKPRPTERRATRQPSDAERAAVEACQLLGLGDDPSRLCPADRLRCDLVSTLRIAIDHAGATAMEGGSADVGRLVTAVEQLTRSPGQARVEDPQWVHASRLVRSSACAPCHAADPVEKFRGRKKSEDADSGFLGVQIHTGTVLFANIRIKP